MRIVNVLKLNTPFPCIKSNVSQTEFDKSHMTRMTVMERKLPVAFKPKKKRKKIDTPFPMEQNPSQT